MTFILTPVVGALSKLGLPKAAGVFATIVGATVAVAMFAVIASSEILNLTSDLGKYRANVIEKVRTVSSASKGGSALAKASEAVASLGTAIEKEIAAKENGQVSDLQGAPRLPVARDETAAAQQPPPVLTSPQDANGRLSVLGFLPVLGQPLAQAALALLFTIFLMVQYRDLLDRIVRVVGTDHLSGTTSAMSEAGGRLSQIFLAQALLNGAFGLFIGLALWAIGIPSAALWGVVSAIMRFVPFIGSVLAAVPPVLLAAAVDPGWSILAATLALFIVGEPVMGHVVEPHVLGRKAGISPFAMVASASFWTLIWGPVGLVLAAPLTMVIVVLGRYVHGLEYFSVLLGDEPPLRPEQEFYHRLLSGDSISAADAFELELSQQTPGGAADGLVLPALGLAALDHRTGRLDEDQIARIKATMDELREITA
ncbi:MAG: AI-2E family transporter, partial [Hyphomicrobium sp.]